MVDLILANGEKIVKFTKINSLQNYPLYGTCLFVGQNKTCCIFLSLMLSVFSFLLLLLLFSAIYCLSVVYGLSDVDLSVIARQGSGSASRSVYGGFVSWEKGEREDGKDSIAVQVRRREGGREGRGNPVTCTIIFISLYLSLSLSLSFSFSPSLLQVAPDTHWSDLQVLILVVSDQKKLVSSTSGMRTSVETSLLINVSG